MNITHYCSKCQCYHADIPCNQVTYYVYACPSCESSPCCCPDEQHTRDFASDYPHLASIDVQVPSWDRRKRACKACGADGVDYLCACKHEREMTHESELARVKDALRTTIPKLDKAVLSSFLSDGDEMRAHALGVLL